MRKTSWIVVTTTLVCLAACAGPPGEAASQEEAAGAGVAEPGAMTPDELGARIGEIYVEALAEVGGLMAARPSPADLRPEVEALKERTVVELVELGRAKAALGEAERATVDSRVRRAVSGVPSDVWAAYAEGHRHYQQAGDAEVAAVIGDFNVITQYADFELLKKQAPEEAERLGIE